MKMSFIVSSTGMKPNCISSLSINAHHQFPPVEGSKSFWEIVFFEIGYLKNFAIFIKKTSAGVSL